LPQRPSALRPRRDPVALLHDAAPRRLSHAARHARAHRRREARAHDPLDVRHRLGDRRDAHAADARSGVQAGAL
ncbi:MAG: Probable aminopeptidase, partial [uncultured Gemmatimonadaceae bacterium]